MGLARRRPRPGVFVDSWPGVLAGAASEAPPAPKRMAFRVSAGRSAKATSGSTPRALTARSVSVARESEPRRPQATTAPSRRVRRGSGTTRSGSTRVRAPMPSQAGQAPWGPLNENIRGSTGGSEIPQSMQAKRSLIHIGSRLSLSLEVSTRMRPSPIFSASSTESVRRPFTPSFTAMRSTTTSRSCTFDQSSTISSPRSICSPSIRARTKPSRRRRSISSLSSPRRARAMGARMAARVPSPRPRMRSTICWTVWASMRLPQLGQWGVPTRAKRRRR